MSKTPRVSVPLTTDLERHLRRMSAENGCSMAANFVKLATVGAEKITLESQFSRFQTELKNELARRGAGDVLEEINAQLANIQSNMPAAKTMTDALPEGVFIPERPARLLFGEALFSAALSAQILTAEMPGTQPKPAGAHIRIAREKANAQLAELLGGA